MEATPAMTSRRPRRVAGWLVWFAVLNLLWLVLIAGFVLEEAVLGLVASAIGATAAQAVREQGPFRFRPRWRWLWRVRILPQRVVRESGWVLRELWRRLTGTPPSPGGFRAVAVTMPDDPDEAAAKRALLIAGESFAPNVYVVGFDDDAGLMLIHELVAQDPR